MSDKDMDEWIKKVQPIEDSPKEFNSYFVGFIIRLIISMSVIGLSVIGLVIWFVV